MLPTSYKLSQCPSLFLKYFQKFFICCEQNYRGFEIARKEEKDRRKKIRKYYTRLQSDFFMFGRNRCFVPRQDFFH